MLSSSLALAIPPQLVECIINNSPPLDEILVAPKLEDLYWRTQILPVEDFDESKVVGVYCSNVMETSWIAEPIKHVLLHLRIPFILMCVADMVETMGIRGDDEFTVRKFLRAWERSFRDDLHSADTREPLMRELAQFYTLLLRSADEEEKRMYKLLLHEVSPFPSWLIDRFKRHLLMISLHPSHKQVQYALQQIQTAPRLYLLNKHSPRTKMWSTAEFVEISKRVPLNVKMEHFVLDFNKRVWTAHLFHGRECRVDVNYTAREVLTQILVFLLPNWYRVWVGMYPHTFEIQRRLWQLKKDNWLPPPTEFVRALLS